LKEVPIIKASNLFKVFGSADESLDINNPSACAQARANGAVIALSGVSFTVNRGEIFVIMGLSGSGKSTLIRCLLRLIEPTAGQIVVNGRNVTAMDEAQLLDFRRTQVAMVFQHYGLLPHRTVLDNVAFGLKLRGVPVKEREEKALAVIHKVGLSGWERNYPSQLSGGMQQRVGIARALAQESDIFLMDEPFSGLDPLIRREMQEQLLELQAEFDKTIVFVTHDLGEAVRLGNRLAVMKEGSIVQMGTPQEIMARPVDDYVRRFVLDEQRLVQIAGAGRKSGRKLRAVSDRSTRQRAAGGEQDVS
jgi:glycine betaine/proline transport system ATP-binding protein